MKSMRLISLWVVLLAAFHLNGVAQEEFFDDVYFSSKKDKKEQVEEKKVVSKEEPKTVVARASRNEAASAEIENGRDVDEYNRRYSSVQVEEPYPEEQTTVEAVERKDKKRAERRSDTEYTERIVRYHSPSKITIAGADQVDLYLSDGYYSYGYDTDYADGGANVNLSINIGNPWYASWRSPWYYGWYDPWYYSYSPWWSYSSWYYRPGWGFGWGSFYAGWYDPWYGPSWGWGCHWGHGYWGGHYYAHHHHYPHY